MFTYHTMNLLKHQKMRLTLQQKIINECKSINLKCNRLHCLLWMWISNTICVHTTALLYSTHIVNWLASHLKWFNLINLFSCIIYWYFLHNCYLFFLKSWMLLVHLCRMVTEFRHKKSWPHRHRIHHQGSDSRPTLCEQKAAAVSMLKSYNIMWTTE